MRRPTRVEHRPPPGLRAFAGLLYEPSVAGPLSILTAAPDDLVSPVARERLRRASPYQVAHLFPNAETPTAGRPEHQYTDGGRLIRRWLRSGVLSRTEAPSVYPYEVVFRLGQGERRLRGLIAEAELGPGGPRLVPHERTLAGPEDRDLALLEAVRADVSPLYVLCPDQALVSPLLDGLTGGPPDREVIDESGARHHLWISPQGGEALAELATGGPLLIADGHHRYAVALAYRRHMRGRAGPGPWDGTMVLLVDTSQYPPVLPYHRVVYGTAAPEEPPGDVIRVAGLAEALARLRDDELTVAVVRLERGQPVYHVCRLEGEPPTVAALHRQVLDGVPAAQLGHEVDPVVADRAVRSGRARAAYLLPPPTMERVWAVVRAGGTLPPKSTYFWPKPRAGLVIRPLFDPGATPPPASSPPWPPPP
jgi:uncharacterized protein (DUF1015 family)